MNRKRVLAMILASAALLVGSAATAAAHDPVVPTADEQCGAQGDQTTPAVTTPTTPTACGVEDNGQTGEQVEQVETGEQIETGEQVQTGEQQEGEH